VGHTLAVARVDSEHARGFLYCCTVHFEDSLNITHQQMH